MRCWGCATPNARGRRSLRRKCHRFRCRKFEKSMLQMQKISGTEVCAHFENLDTATGRADAIKERVQSRARDFQIFSRKFAAFSAPKI